MTMTVDVLSRYENVCLSSRYARDFVQHQVWALWWRRLDQSMHASMYVWFYGEIEVNMRLTDKSVPHEDAQFTN